MKAVYFFAGEGGGANERLYTTHPLDPRDEHWNSDPSTRAWVIDRMVQAHVNTVVMSYWSDMPASSPMKLDATSIPGVLDAVEGRPLVVLPAIESGNAWRFADEFPVDASGQPAPGLVNRIGDLVSLFKGRMHLWAQLYDREGQPRYAINVIHAYSSPLASVPPFARQVAGDAFAAGFDAVAASVEARFGVRVGFTLDAVAGQGYAADPATNGAALERTRSVLAIQDFEPEVWSGVAKSSPPCPAHAASCPPPYDNNTSNLGAIADWKRARTSAWLATGVPVILSVSNGMDGRFVWAKNGDGYWGDNLDATDDRFRNWVSELKGRGLAGITFDTWNGYTEGYAAVLSVEHEDTVYEWLSDLFRPDPRRCSHMHFASGVPTHRVYGAICTRWVKMGADRRTGGPISDELPTARGRVSEFAGGRAIYWSHATGAHEVHGIIATTYRAVGADASCLGLPVHDEEPYAGGRRSLFEHGAITWTRGETLGQVTCS
jgi:hypothetical protein